MPHTCRRKSQEGAGWNVEQLLESEILSALYRLCFLFNPFFFKLPPGNQGKTHKRRRISNSVSIAKLHLLSWFEALWLQKPKTWDRGGGGVRYWNPRKTQLWVEKKKCNIIINKLGDDISVYFRIFYTVCCDSDLGNIKEILSQSASFVFFY